MELKSAISDLKRVSSNLRPNDKGFADSLMSQWEKKGSLSEKQAKWVLILLERALIPSPEPVKVELGKLAKFHDLFKSAKSKLKWPKISIETESGKPIRLSLAGPNSKYAGDINVTDGGPFGDNKWYGRIQPDGTFIQSPSSKVQDDMEEITATLRAMARDPAGYAIKHGTKTGNCCFCNKSLEAEKSVTVGFGPVCAKNWGLEAEWKAANK